MQNRRNLTAYICATLLLCASARAATSSQGAQKSSTFSIARELIDLQKAFTDAQERGDAEYVKNALADDFTQIETNGNSSERTDFLKDIHPPEHPGPAPILYDFRVIELDEGCAVVTYKGVFAGDQLERYQHLSDTWVKQGGKWKLKFQQSTLNLWSAHDLD